MNKKLYPKKDDPLFLLLDAMTSSDNPSDAILRSEKRGQELLVNSEVLPKEIKYGTHRQLKEMGIIFGEDADDLFVYITLPKGWKKVATDHSMWSRLLDDKDRERAAIFYKAAYYDRCAHITINKRFYATFDYDNRRGVVKDCGKTILETDQLEEKPNDRNEILVWYDKQDKLVDYAIAWLSGHYPDWQNPLAYWD